MGHSDHGQVSRHMAHACSQSVVPNVCSSALKRMLQAALYFIGCCYLHIHWISMDISSLSMFAGVFMQILIG